jgi:hypothetical protein
MSSTLSLAVIAVLIGVTDRPTTTDRTHTKMFRAPPR